MLISWAPSVTFALSIRYKNKSSTTAGHQTNFPSSRSHKLIPNQTKMFKYVIVICALIACVAGKPGHLLSAQLLAAPAPVVTATSSQLIARNFNGIAAAPVIASVPVAAPVPVVKAVAPVATRIISPFAAPLIAKYADAAPLHYTTPLGYATAPQPIYF
ncbi:uncharacterized protein LOC117894265 [Drosophila subobscura]|uniref:uncharacterized protein LOC117894265 n=1 Tax=Drosophila subobscura TaxID=7241 RepID=UPI00155AF3BF|nr:uncharacterized protein LOC117894265 [Drosophila subobscura]